MLPELAVLVILVTEAALIASHVTYAHPWWRRPLLFSDRWHILSALSHYPAVLLILWLAVPEVAWLPLALVSWAIWQFVKLAAGKHWPPIWVQMWRWLRSRPWRGSGG